MIPPTPFVSSIEQFEDSPSVTESHVQGSEWEWDLSETTVASTFSLPSFSMQEQEVWQFSDAPSQHSSHSFLHTSTSHYSDPHFPDANLYSTLVDQVDLDSLYAECQSLVFPESNSSFDSNISNSVPTFTNPIQDNIPPENGLDFLFIEHPGVNNMIPQAGDGVPGHSAPSTFSTSPEPYEMSPEPQMASMGQRTEAIFQTINSNEFPFVDIPPPDLSSSQPEAHFPASNLADPVAGIYNTSYLVESPREVAYGIEQSLPYTVRPPLKQQSMLSEKSVDCGWKNGDEPVCGVAVTRATLSEHLSTHGIKKMSRDRLIKCNWFGCKRKRPMNRESILRHICEIHLRLKRRSRRGQGSSL